MISYKGGCIPEGNNHPPLKPNRPIPRPKPTKRRHIDQHEVPLRLHLVVVLVQVRRHRRPAHPHYLRHMLAEEEAYRD